jgi:hypothetical protein
VGRLNPVAAVILAVAVVALIVAVRGTQDNLLSAIAGRPVELSPSAGRTAPSNSPEPTWQRVNQKPSSSVPTADSHGPYSGYGIYGYGGK